MYISLIKVRSCQPWCLYWIPVKCGVSALIAYFANIEFRTRNCSPRLSLLICASYHGWSDIHIEVESIPQLRNDAPFLYKLDFRFFVTFSVIMRLILDSSQLIVTCGGKRSTWQKSPPNSKLLAFSSHARLGFEPRQW